MRSSAAAGGIAAIVFGLAGLVSTGLQLAQQTLGFEDTDSPAVHLAYLRDHLENYVQQGLVMFVMALALAILVFAVWDVLAGRSGSLALRTVSSIGLVAAACFFLFGVLRYGVRPLLYIDSLSPSWGESAYLVQQIAGVHGFAAAAILTMSGWAVGVGVLGYRSGALPRWLCLLALIPALRLLSILGPLLRGRVMMITRLALPTRLSSRVAYPIVPPGSSPSARAIYSAAARAANRRGTSSSS